VRITGKAIPDALVRQAPIPGFDQAKCSRAHVLCIGAGGLISHAAHAFVRKGIGALTILDDDLIEESNLNRQHFYADDTAELEKTMRQRQAMFASPSISSYVSLRESLAPSLHAKKCDGFTRLW
jgi:molybdopterin/thiamine biosynthesis adenylyltransferase